MDAPNIDSESGDSGSNSGPGMQETALSHCTSTEVEFEYNLDLAPRSQKLLILTIGGITMTGMFTGNPERDADIMAFFPLPKRNKKKEEQLRKEGKYPWCKSVY